jgi:tight adherence protein B
MTLEMVAAIVFLCTTTFVFGLCYSIRGILSSETGTIKKRVDSLGSQYQSPEYSKQALAFLSEHKDARNYAIFSEFPPLLNIPLLFQQAGITSDVVRWLILTVASATGAAFLVWLLSKSLLYTLLAWPIFLSIPYLHVLRKRKRRIAAFEAHLPQCLELISRSLRAGHPFSVGLQMVSTEMPAPVGTEFGRVFNENQMGLPLEDSLRDLATRVALLDLRFFVLSVLIQHQTGGDLAEVLDNLSTVIRERLRVLGQVRALTAEGRLSGWVLCLLPVFVFFAIQLANPGYLTPLLETPVGRKMLYVALGMQFIGVLLIRKIVNIKV